MNNLCVCIKFCHIPPNCTFTVFVIIVLQTLFHTENPGVVVIYFCITYHMPSISGALVIDIRPETTENVHNAIMVLFYVLQKKITIITVIYKSMLPYIKSDSCINPYMPRAIWISLACLH